MLDFIHTPSIRFGGRAETASSRRSLSFYVDWWWSVHFPNSFKLPLLSL